MIPLRSSLKRLLLSEYYLGNLAVLATYPLWRHAQSHAQSQEVPASPLSWVSGSTETASFAAVEFQLGAALASAALIYGYRSSTCDAVVASAVWFAQLFVLLMACLVDKAAFASYAVAFGLLFLLSSPPWYQGPDKVERMTAATFYSTCVHGGSSSGSSSTAHDDVTYVVYFYTDWSAKCRHGYTLFADLSNRFTTDKLRFAKLDVGMWPQAGTVAGVEVSCVSGQLPSVITYEKGQEDRRVPSTRKNRKHIFTKLDLINGLGLDIKLARSLPAHTS